MVKHRAGSTAADNKEEITINAHKEQEAAHSLDQKANSAQGFLPACQSLVSPKTLLSGSAVTRGESALIMRTSPSPHKSNSLVLCSTTVSCLSSRGHRDRPSAERGAPRLAGEEERAEVFLLESEERRGSYDDVVLEGNDDVIRGESGCNHASDFDGDTYLWEESDNTASAASPSDNRRERVSENILKLERTASKSALRAMGWSPKTIPSQVNMCNSLNEIWQQSELLKADAQASKLNQRKTGPKISMKVQERSKLPERKSKTNTLSSVARPKAEVCHFNQTPKSSFSIHTDPVRPSGDSVCTTKRVLASLSANILTSKRNCSLKGVQRVTSPLCSCGRRAKRQVVSNGGPNHGRGFYCCAVRRSGGSGRIQKGCEFFKWESAVIKSSSVASAASRSSVSLCQVNSSLSLQPIQRLSRKSC